MKVEVPEKDNTIKRTIIIAVSIIAAGLIIIYFSMVVFFMNRFHFKTYLNGENVSCKTIKSVEDDLSTGSDYKLKIIGTDGDIGTIDGKTINLKYEVGDKVDNLGKMQNPFGWLVNIFHEDDYKLKFDVNYDEELLKENINKLSCFNITKKIPAKDAALVYEDGKYKIQKEVIGNEVERDKLYSLVVDSLKNDNTELNLVKEECYKKPKITADSEAMVKAKATIDKYMKTSVTYVRGNDVIDTVDGNKIHQWIKFDDNFKVSLDKDAILKYMQVLDDTYDTVGKARQFKTTGGNTITVVGGDYGWIMDSVAEADNLCGIIKTGETISKEPEYIQTGNVPGKDDIGNTYVEISISQQHLWLYSEGKLITHGDVVTGNNDSQHATPLGVYYVYSMEPNSILRGPGYATEVGFWMPFNRDIGIHDATWRSSFGGQIYMGDGSHGCINCPYDLAQTIYNTITVGTPVICY